MRPTNPDRFLYDTSGTESSSTTWSPPKRSRRGLRDAMWCSSETASRSSPLNDLTAADMRMRSASPVPDLVSAAGVGARLRMADESPLEIDVAVRDDDDC